MYWIAYQWGRAVWAFDHDGGVWVQGFAAIVTAAITIALAAITYRSLHISRRAVDVALMQARESARQTAQAQQQLLLMAHPNAVMKVETSAYSHEITVSMTNRGAYPFRISAARMWVSDGDSAHETDLQLAGVTVSSGDTVRASEVAQVRGAKYKPLEVTLKFECEDVLGLVRQRYSHTERLSFADSM